MKKNKVCVLFLLDIKTLIYDSRICIFWNKHSMLAVGPERYKKDKRYKQHLSNVPFKLENGECNSFQVTLNYVRIHRRLYCKQRS